MKILKFILNTVALIFLFQNISAQDFRQWATTPPMGWNSWDCYGPTVEEHEVKANADYMAKHLKKFGWEY
ncbi:MAG: alpha-galactosidase, partial [Prevotellaceae bacterium]|nr:alpha-galactosidase [Prevotellaceae bacterium]